MVIHNGIITNYKDLRKFLVRYFPWVTSKSSGIGLSQKLSNQLIPLQKKRQKLIEVHSWPRHHIRPKTHPQLRLLPRSCWRREQGILIYLKDRCRVRAESKEHELLFIKVSALNNIPTHTPNGMWGGNAGGESFRYEEVVVLVGRWVDLTQCIWSFWLLLFCNVQINGKDKLLRRDDLREDYNDSAVLGCGIQANISHPFPVFLVLALSHSKDKS